jgi:hypothetical protein
VAPFFPPASYDVMTLFLRVPNLDVITAHQVLYCKLSVSVSLWLFLLERFSTTEAQRTHQRRKFNQRLFGQSRPLPCQTAKDDVIEIACAEDL